MYFLFKDFIYLFLERGDGREGQKHHWVVGCLSHTPLLGTRPATQACALTGNQAGDPLVHRPVLNPLNHTSQGSCIFLTIIMTLLILGDTTYFCQRSDSQAKSSVGPQCCSVRGKAAFSILREKKRLRDKITKPLRGVSCIIYYLEPYVMF